MFFSWFQIKLYIYIYILFRYVDIINKIKNILKNNYYLIKRSICKNQNRLVRATWIGRKGCINVNDMMRDYINNY